MVDFLQIFISLGTIQNSHLISLLAGSVSVKNPQTSAVTIF